MTRFCKAFLLLAATACTLGVAADARAYEEQASVDFTLGYSLLYDSRDLGQHGIAADVGGAFGISDVGVVRGLAGYLACVGDGEVAHAARLRVEAMYLLDVLQFVPFFGVGAGLLFADQRSGPFALRPGAHVVVGADYLLSRTLTIGLDVRTGVLFERGSALNTTDVALRVSRMFETF